MAAARRPMLTGTATMRRLRKGVVYRSCVALRLPSVLQRALFSRELVILMYHGVVREPLPLLDYCFLSEARFACQMDYLRAHFDVLPLGEAVGRLQAGKIKRPTAAITFDDGFQNVHDVAFPVLRRLGLPATMFLATGFVDHDATIWFCQLLQALAVSQRKQLRWRGTEFDLSRTAGQVAASARLQAGLKELPHDELMRELEAIASELEVAPEALSHPEPHYRVLDGASIRAMVQSGLFEFGAHTANHTILTRVSPERARAEIEESIEATESFAGQPCRLFAYPNGRAQDYNTAALDTLKAAGITAAVTTLDGSNPPETPPLELRRYGVGAGGALERLEMTVQRTLARCHSQP